MQENVPVSEAESLHASGIPRSADTVEVLALSTPSGMKLHGNYSERREQPSVLALARWLKFFIYILSHPNLLEKLVKRVVL